MRDRHTSHGDRRGDAWCGRDESAAIEAARWPVARFTKHALIKTIHIPILVMGMVTLMVLM
jgi:hypothetical protein